MPNDGYDTPLFDLALATRNGCDPSAVLPPDEGAHQLSDYEKMRLQKIRRNKERFESLGLGPLSALAGEEKHPPVTKKRPASKRKKVVEKRPRSSRLKAVEKRPRSLRLKEVDKSQSSAAKSKGEAVVVNPTEAMILTFGRLLDNIERFHPDTDDDSGKRGRFKLATIFDCAIQQYILDGCPMLKVDEKWDYVVKTFAEQKANTPSAGSSRVHCLKHLPKKTKFAGAQIVQSKCDYPQFSCKGGCQKRVRTYCSCSPGIIICNECFVQHKIVKEAEAASDFYANEGDPDDES